MVKRKNYNENSSFVHSKSKKPFYKSWWFIVIAVLMLGRAIVTAGEDDVIEQTDTEEVAEVIEEESDKEKADMEAKEKEEQEQIAKEKEKEDAQKKEEEELAKEKAEQEAKQKEEQKKKEKTEKEKIAKEKEKAEQKEKEEKAEQKEKEEIAKEKEEQEQERLAKEKAEQETPYEIIDGVALFTNNSSIGWSVGSHIDVFSYDMAQLLIEHHADITNGAVFRSVKSLVDSYGNEANYNVIVVYYSQETIEKINYDNWPTLDASGLYTTADALFAHPAFKENGVAQNVSAPETAPSLYFNLLGTEVD